MWGGRKRGGGAASGTTLISRDANIVGDIQFSGTLQIEGLVQGTVVAVAGREALVRVVGKGRVEGQIHAPNAVIDGTVEGDVHCSGQLELASRARVTGNVYYARVQMAAGAEVNGSLTHVEDVSSGAQGRAGPSPAAR